jgi:hypothetical protein
VLPPRRIPYLRRIVKACQPNFFPHRTFWLRWSFEGLIK